MHADMDFLHKTSLTGCSYFYDANKAVDGCDVKGSPGYDQMEWLNVQLSLMRDRNQKAILIGHVPPTWTSEKMNWDES